jgi:hypothetical protein
LRDDSPFAAAEQPALAGAEGIESPPDYVRSTSIPADEYVEHELIEDPTPQDPERVRANASISLVVLMAMKSLRQVSRISGIGGQLSLSAGPSKWPLLFGVYIEVHEYAGVECTLLVHEGDRVHRVGLRSHTGMAFVLIPPESWPLRPYPERQILISLPFVISTRK